MNTMATLIKREFWEHRPLWIAPLAVSLCILLVTVVASGHVTLPDFESGMRRGPNAAGAAIFFKSGIVTGVLLFQYAIASIVVGFYVLDSLYTERKDRSILFWKSLPVSDTSTVLSKFIVANAIMPVGVFVLAVLTSLLAAGIVLVRSDALAAHLWDAELWMRAYGVFFVALLASILWYAPVIAYLLLISAWARRSVLLWALLPPIGALLVESYAFGTHYVAAFLKYRLSPAMEIFVPVEPEGTLPRIDVLHFLSVPGLWIGLALGALLLFGAIRIRRFRDDT
jgi:ABC-2 type transport system permease protein